MRTLALVAIVLALFAQVRSPRTLVNAPRQLTDAEIATVLAASRQALAGRTFRLSSGRGGRGLEVLMGRAGQPKMIRWAGAVTGGTVGGLVAGDSKASPPTETHWRQEFIEITDYTGRPARRCNGAAEQGEMVVQYRLDTSTHGWTTIARARDTRDFGGPGIAPVFEMLQGTGAPASGERTRVGTRWARAFVAKWTPPAATFSEPPLLIGDPLPNVAGEPVPTETVQSLWIDTGSLLPLRWEANRRGLLMIGFNFTYASIDLRPPRRVTAPDCIR